MTATNAAISYRYIAGLAKRLAPVAAPRILDFGCGPGKLVAHGVEQGLDMTGADTFEGIYEDWRNQADPVIRDRLHKIENGRLPFADDSFDMVVSNQVFEHIPEHRPCFAEIHRVLKPGGKFIAAFPVHETWYEGHAGLYFAHWLTPFPKMQHWYCLNAARLGFGITGKRPAGKWADIICNVMQTSCFYLPQRRVMDDLTAVWHREPERYETDFMRFRLQNSRFAGIEKRIPRWLDPLLRFVYLKRAGIVLVLTKGTNTAQAAPDAEPVRRRA